MFVFWTFLGWGGVRPATEVQSPPRRRLAQLAGELLNPHMSSVIVTSAQSWSVNIAAATRGRHTRRSPSIPSGLIGGGRPA